MSGSADMDVVWQDSVGSFLDSSGAGASSFAAFTGGDGALWSSSADSPVFSGQSVLWDSGADAPIDSHISGLTPDSSGSDTSPLLTGGWIADGTSGLAGSMLDGSVLWAGAGSDTSTLTNSNGVGLGSLDLGTASGSSQWQQFVDSFGSQFATWAADAPHLLWTGTSSQPPITVPGTDGLQALQIAAGNSLALPTLGTLSPGQLMWTQPSAAPGLTTGPSLADAAPSPAISGPGAAAAQNVAALSAGGDTPIAGVLSAGTPINPSLTQS